MTDWIFEPGSISGSYLRTEKKHVIMEFRDVFCEMTGVKVRKEYMPQALELFRKICPIRSDISREELDIVADQISRRHMPWRQNYTVLRDDYLLSFKRLLVNGAVTVRGMNEAVPEEDREAIGDIVPLLCFLPVISEERDFNYGKVHLKAHLRKRFGVSDDGIWKRAAFATQPFLSRKDEGIVKEVFDGLSKRFDRFDELLRRSDRTYDGIGREEFFRGLSKLMEYFERSYGFGLSTAQSYI